MSFSLAVSIKVMARAKVSAPVSAPATSQFFRPIPIGCRARSAGVNAGLKLHQSPEQKFATFLGFAGPILHHLVEFRFALRIPRSSGHLYRQYPATPTDLIRPGIPGHPATPISTLFKLLRGNM